jgi:hypothetical protein
VPAGGSFNVSTSAVAGSGFDDTVVEVYSGTCGSLTSIGCNDDIIDGEERFSSVTVRGQTPGNTVYVRVFGFDATVATGQFGICATLPPANDNCAGAIALTTGATCTVTTGTTVGASDGPGPAPTCGGGGAYNDVWYSTVVPAGGRIAVTTSAVAGSAFDDTVVDLFTGTCSSLTAVACNDDAGGAGFSSAIASGLTVGSTIYIRVSGYDSSIPTGQFGICATIPPPAPANDNPAGAITLPIAATCTPLNGTNASATTTPVNGYVNGTNPNAACGIAANPKDVWYKFTTAASGAGSTAVTIQVTGMAAGYLRLFSSPGGAATGPFTEIACSSGGNNNTVSAPLTVNTLTANTTYYVFVAGFGSNDTQGDFTICAIPATPLAANDAAVQIIYSTGKAPVSAPQVIQAVIRNAGSAALANIPVILTVAGTSPFTNGKLVASLAPGASTTVTFDPYTPTAVGNNTLTVTLPADAVTTNNTQTFPVVVTPNSLSYLNDSEPVTASVGVSGTTPGGTLATKYTINTASAIGEVKLSFLASATTTSTYQVVVLNATAMGLPGSVLFTSPTLNRPTAAGVVTVPITNTPVTSTFFVGLKEVSGNVGIGYQVENPLRSGTFYYQISATSAWTDVNTTTLQTRLGIEVGFSTRVLSTKPSAALAQAIELYPNPAHQSFALRLPALTGQRTAKLTLLNTLGQQVQMRTLVLGGSGTETQFNVSGLAAGIYTLQIQTTDQLATKQVVIE